MKYAFLDRDGTLIYEPQDTFEVKSVDQLEILDGVFETLRELIDRGYKLVMVTNQDGLGGDKYPLDEFKTVENEMLRRFREKGIEFDSILICPHFPEQNCECRKPKLGLVNNFSDIDLDSSIMIGDRDSDIEFADNLGIKSYKLDVNKGMKGIKL